MSDGQSAYRNGFKRRKVSTGEGAVELFVPQTRDGPEPFQTVVLGTFQRRSETLEALIPQLYVKGIGQDTDLLAQTLEQYRRQREESIKDLEAEKLALERELQRLDGELRKLAAKVGQDRLATDRMADSQDRIRVVEQRATEVRDQIMGLDGLEARPTVMKQFLKVTFWILRGNQAARPG